MGGVRVVDGNFTREYADLHICARRLCVCVCVYGCIYGQGFSMCVSECSRVCTQIIHVCVYMFTYTHTGSVSVRIHIYIHCMCVCTYLRIHTEFSCVMSSMFTYICHYPVQV